METRNNIWYCSSIGILNVGKRFHHLVFGGTAGPKVDSANHKILNLVEKMINLKKFPKNGQFSMHSHIIYIQMTCKSVYVTLIHTFIYVTICGYNPT